MVEQISEVCVHGIVQRHRSTYGDNFFNIIDGYAARNGVLIGSGDKRWESKEMCKNIE